MTDIEKVIPVYSVSEWMEHIKNNSPIVTKLNIEHGPFDALYDLFNRPYDDCFKAVKQFGELCYESGRNYVLVDSQRIAKQMMDNILYDNDFVNREEPFDMEKHSGDWWKRISAALIPPIALLGSTLFTDEFVIMLSIGMYDEVEDALKKYPELLPVHDLLNEYFEYLEEL